MATCVTFPDCKFTLPHTHVTHNLGEGSAFPYITETVVPGGQRGLRCVICDEPSERANCGRHEPGIDVHERVERIAMHLNAPLHPDLSERELRMLRVIGTLVSWGLDVLPKLRPGISYPLMHDELLRIGREFGPWASD